MNTLHKIFNSSMSKVHDVTNNIMKQIRMCVSDSSSEEYEQRKDAKICLQGM